MKSNSLFNAARRGMLAALLAAVAVSPVLATQTVVNFDNVVGANTVVEATRVTTAFAGQGVTFSGPGGNDGMAVVNAASFPGTGFSTPNVLAWYVGQQLADGGFSTGPETITLTSLKTFVQISVASSNGLGVGQTVKIEAYNFGDLLVGSSQIILGPNFALLSVRAFQIKKVVISSSATLLVADDLVTDDAPLNDLCLDATPITPGSYTGSTSQGYSDGSGCGNSGGAPDVWYAYTPATSGLVTINTTGFNNAAGTNFDTILSVHSGCPGDGTTLLACNDDAPYTPNTGETGQSEINMAVSQGETYFIRVTGFGGAKGNFKLNLTDPTAAPPALGSACGWVAQFPSGDSQASGFGGGSFADSVRLGSFTPGAQVQYVEETLFGDRPWITGLRLDQHLVDNGLSAGAVPPTHLDWRVLVNNVEVGTFTFGDLLAYPAGPFTLEFGPFAPIQGPNYKIRMETTNTIAGIVGSVFLGYSGDQQGYATLTSDPSFTFAASARGSWDSDGNHEAANDNTFTGYAGGIGVTKNAYFSFPIVRGLHAATYTLRLEVTGYTSTDPSETFSIHQVTTDPATLEADGVGLMGVFNDLQDGTSFGQFTVTAADVGTVKEIPLLDINTTENAFAGLSPVVSFGLHCDTAPTMGSTQGASFSLASEARTHELVIEYCPPAGRVLGDFDDSGCTDIQDFLFLLDYWNGPSPIGGDVISINDFLALLDNWNTGSSCP